MPLPKVIREQILKDQNESYAWYQDYERICSQTTPNINEIERLLNKKNDLYFPTEPDTKALELKLKAMTHVPTTIEKTMTPAQLFVVDSPLWALDFAGEDIDKLLKRLKDQPNTEEAFNVALRSIQNPMLIVDEFGNLRLNKSHPRNKEVATRFGRKEIK
mgnify:FL=1